MTPAARQEGVAMFEFASMLFRRRHVERACYFVGGVKSREEEARPKRRSRSTSVSPPPRALNRRSSNSAINTGEVAQ